MTSTVVIYLAVTAVAVGWGLLDGFRLLYLYPGKRPTIMLAVSPAVGIALGLAVVGLSRMIVYVFDWAKRLHMEFHIILQGLTGWEAFVLAAASAIGEEALFRGAMVPSLGLWWSSAIFGLAHLPVRPGLWPWPIIAFVMGLAFGVLYQQLGDLGAPIVAHFLINLINLRFIANRSFPEAAPVEVGPSLSPPADEG